MTVRILVGDAREKLRELEDESVHCVLTSPPYWGLRSYNLDDGIGQEETLAEHLENLRLVFREVWRVLRKDGLAFVNYGDSHASSGVQRVSRSDICGRESRDSQENGRVSQNLCDECQAILQSRNPDSAIHHARVLTSSVRESSPEHIVPGLGHASSSDSSRRDEKDEGRQRSPSQSVSDVLDAPASTMLESSQQPLDACSHCPNCGSCLSVLRSDAPYALACAHTGWRLCTRDTEGKLRACFCRTEDRHLSSSALGYSSTMHLKNKDLMLLPARVALMLQEDGWWVRSEIVWWKRNAMPESARGRPGQAHEKVFMLAKSGKPLFWQNRLTGVVLREIPSQEWLDEPEERTGFWRTTKLRPNSPPRIRVWEGHSYFYDDEAVRTPGSPSSGSPPLPRSVQTDKKPRGHERVHQGFTERWDAMSRDEQVANGSGLRNVWDIPIQGYRDAHFATFPQKLAEIAIVAGTSEKGCCPECGAPWIRHRKLDVCDGMGRSWHSHENDDGVGNRIHWDTWETYERGETLGWVPSCGCSSENPVPCTVLDPFGGAGTTGLVAEQLGRDSVMVEMNPEYAEMARARIEEDSMPLFPSEVNKEET